MNTTPRLIPALCAALLVGASLCASVPAQAHQERHGWDERGRHSHYHSGERGWRGDDHPGRGHARGHYKSYRGADYPARVVIREKVIVHSPARPVVREHHYHYSPAPAYAYSRDPAIVIGVSVPPIVIPIR